jgi:hypothetical protein
MNDEIFEWLIDLSIPTDEVRKRIEILGAYNEEIEKKLQSREQMIAWAKEDLRRAKGEEMRERQQKNQGLS